MARRRPARTLLEVCIARGGIVKGARVCSFVIRWAMCADALGREPEVVEYIEWWNERDRTAWRHLAEFREVFATDQTPQFLAAVIAPAVAGIGKKLDELTAAKTAGTIELPADLLPASA
jgi:hypothetical protein